MVHTDKFSLHESMSGTELGDIKMDIKVGIEDADTPEKLLKSGKIKPVDQLNVNELIGIFDDILSLEMIWISG